MTARTKITLTEAAAIKQNLIAVIADYPVTLNQAGAIVDLLFAAGVIDVDAALHLQAES